MTREEAKTALFNAINSAWEYESEQGTGEAMEALSIRNEALSILAPTPRKEPPTVDEVGDGEECWYCILDSWQLDTGQRVREFWAPNENESWLPLSALPKGDV